ncbi:Threonylcarbamoyladenosine tRNA methylthiotransferase [Thelohanellus kitauei]|uniref:tRNA-t(6)A37 methylthiotransferase n=1 Tax=Thelohanellus kitauei TaxID=669202 RepID=A0A0C2M926_THEKT|nr:Threonylcarbamoyladenosine tRNA methylthiotransferase [Thelohanellus kitauei]
MYGVSAIGINQIDRIVEVVEETLKGNTVRLLHKDRTEGKYVPLHNPKVRRNNFVEIIAISTGCLNQCTYCKTKHSRGELGSYSVEEIVQRVQQSLSEGVMEIWITSEDTGAYGKDIGTSLPVLLREIIAVLPKYAMMRVGMTNPPYILEHMQAMSEILNHPRVYSFLHIPVQSGSDCVLTEMAREYNVEDFCTLVDFMRQHVENINIATDVICGFPTETDEDFMETFELIKKYKFHSLFINQFYPRPGTVAARMVQLPAQIAKQRTKTISELFKSYSLYDDRVGQEYDVLIVEYAKDKQHLVGHNKFYEQILIEKDDTLMGKWAKVRVTETSKFYMKGIVLDIL